MSDKPSVKYVALHRPPKAWASETEYGWQERPTIQAIESDPTPVATGLLDANGTSLYRVPERVAMGFCRE